LLQNVHFLLFKRFLNFQIVKYRSLTYLVFKKSNFEVPMGFGFGLNVILPNVIAMARTVAEGVPSSGPRNCKSPLLKLSN